VPLSRRRAERRLQHQVLHPEHVRRQVHHVQPPVLLCLEPLLSSSFFSSSSTLATPRDLPLSPSFRLHQTRLYLSDHTACNESGSAFVAHETEK
jgi:hypothetical protein